MKMEQDRKPSALAALFIIVPEPADMVVIFLHPNDTDILMTETEPSLTDVCQTIEGGIDRLMNISREGYRNGSGRRVLPRYPRLLREEWNKKLVGKRRSPEDAEGDAMVSLALRFGCASSWTVCSAFCYQVAVVKNQKRWRGA